VAIFDALARHEKVGIFLHLHHQGMKFRHLFCEKKFLENIINLRIIKELADFGYPAGLPPKLLPADL